MRFCCFLLLACFLFSCEKEQDATRQNSSDCFRVSFLPTGIPGNVLSVFFRKEEEGFISTYRGGIYKTQDSAKTWIKMVTPTDLPIRAIRFLSATEGFAVGGLNACEGTGCVPPGGFILHTKDGGQNWETIYLTLNQLEITDLVFIDEKNGLCVGDNVIYKTTDGGKSWTENQVNNLQGKMMKIGFVDNRTGFIVCTNDKILKTIDGGISWQVMSTGEQRGYYTLSAASGSFYIGGSGEMLKSTDAGLHWTRLPASPADIFAVHFITKDIGYAFGRGNYSGGDFGLSYGSMYCTSDGGNSWRGTGAIKESGPIVAVSFPTAAIGYAVSGAMVVRIEPN